MMFLAPWALVGLVAVAAPVLVHWLARHQAMRLRFPSIQFLVRSSPVSVRRYRLRDLALLAVRAGIVVAAVLALAQPVWVRPGAPAARPARAVVIDTSASLQRALADGRVGADVAREIATAALGIENDLSGPASSQLRPLRSFSIPNVPAVTISTERLAEGVGQASAWLARQGAPRELVVVSDFQVGALVESDLDTVPENTAVRLAPVAVSGPVPAVPAPVRGRLRVLVGGEQAAAAAAAEAAARATEKTSGIFSGEKDSRRLFEVGLVFASAPTRNELRRSAQPVDSPELFGWVADIQSESRRLGIAAEKTSGVFFAKKTPDVFSETGLAVFTDADPGSVEAAALMTAILRAAAPPAVSDAEREPDTLAPEVLKGWQRLSAPVPSAGRAGERNDGRWFWLLALALFGLEAWMRRRLAVAHAEVAHADAA